MADKIVTQEIHGIVSEGLEGNGLLSVYLLPTTTKSEHDMECCVVDNVVFS
jgi:hypothetical protein